MLYVFAASHWLQSRNPNLVIFLKPWWAFDKSSRRILVPQIFAHGSRTIRTRLLCPPEVEEDVQARVQFLRCSNTRAVNFPIKLRIFCLICSLVVTPSISRKVCHNIIYFFGASPLGRPVKADEFMRV